MAATIRLKRKTFGIGNLGSAIANTWKSGALGKAKIIGGATVAAGGAGALYGGAKFVCEHISIKFFFSKCTQCQQS